MFLKNYNFLYIFFFSKKLNIRCSCYNFSLDYNWTNYSYIWQYLVKVLLCYFNISSRQQILKCIILIYKLKQRFISNNYVTPLWLKTETETETFKHSIMFLLSINVLVQKYKAMQKFYMASKRNVSLVASYSFQNNSFLVSEVTRCKNQ